MKKQILDFARGLDLKPEEPLIINIVDHTGKILDRIVIKQSKKKKA